MFRENFERNRGNDEGERSSDPTFNPERSEEEATQERIATIVASHPLADKIFARYRIFAEIYHGAGGDKREEVRKRAREIFEDTKTGELDPMFREIVDSHEDPVNEDWQRRLVLVELKKHPDLVNRLARAEQEGTIDDELRRINVERATRGERTEAVGNIIVELSEDGKTLIRHLPRIATSSEETLRLVNESLVQLAHLLQTEERFQNVEKIDGVSWLFGEGRKNPSSLYEDWHHYTSQEMDQFANNNPDAY